MRAFVFVLLATVSVHAEAGADPYTVGQVAHGLTNGGIITGVDHGHGVVAGVGAIGNRAVHHVAGVNTVHNVAGVYNAVPVNTVASTVPVYNTHHAIATPAVRHVAGVSSVYPNVYSSVYPNVYSGVNHVYGKREAEAEAEAEAGVVGYHTGVSHGVYPYTAFRAGVTHAVPTVTGVTHAVPSVHAGVYSPVVRRVGVSSVYPNVYSNMYSNVYSGLNHVYGKREAEAEPEANHHFYSNLYHPYTTYTGVRNVVPAVYYS